MFVELMPLLGERTVMITVSRVNQNSIRVNFIPFRKKEDENAVLATPLVFSGTPEELDRELGRNLASYVEQNLRLQSTHTEAKAEMEAAAKAARDQAEGIAPVTRSRGTHHTLTNCFSVAPALAGDDLGEILWRSWDLVMVPRGDFISPGAYMRRSSRGETRYRN